MTPEISPTAQISSEATVNGGTIEGIVRGGTINAGHIDHRTIVLGGTVNGGIFQNCQIRGGTIYDLDAADVTIWDGVYRGGVVRTQNDILVMTDREGTPIVTMVRDDSPAAYLACVGDQPHDLNAVEETIRRTYPHMNPQTRRMQYEPLIDRVRAVAASWKAANECPPV